MNKWYAKLSIASLMFGIIWLWQTPAAQASVSCTCSGSASINAAGQVVAIAAGYAQTNFTSDCTDIGGTASGWTCSISNLTGPADSETQCTSATPSSIAAMAGLPSSYSAFYSATGSCRLTDDSSSSDTSGWRTIVPKDCQIKKGGCDICEVSKIFTNAADLIAGAVSAVALLMFILGGLFWIFSGGVESRVETGKKILLGTVSGLALVFVAWFGVNVIVRTAALSGGKATSTIFTSGTFSKEWWSFEGCYPALPTTCKGLNIGAVCAASPCSSDRKNPNCSCYRAIDLTGDTSTCDGDDTTSITGANSTTKQCMCADGCEQFSATTAGAKYVCTTKTSTIETTHEVNTALVCKDSTKVCAKPK